MPNTRRGTSRRSRNAGRTRNRRGTIRNSKGRRGTGSDTFLPVHCGRRSVALSHRRTIGFTRLNGLCDRDKLSVNAMGPVCDGLSCVTTLGNMAPRTLISNVVTSSRTRFHRKLIRGFNRSARRLRVLLRTRHSARGRGCRGVLRAHARARRGTTGRGRRDLGDQLTGRFLRLRTRFPRVTGFTDMPPTIGRVTTGNVSLVSTCLHFGRDRSGGMATTGRATRDTRGTSANDNDDTTSRNVSRDRGHFESTL